MAPLGSRQGSGAAIVGMSDVFISYARSTATQAQRIAEALRALGYNVWRDDDLPAHRPYADVIDERLRGARAVVVVWSAEAAKSQWVRAEADLARNMGTLVQLRIDDTIPPLPFNQIECADLSGWKGDPNAQGWRKVAGSVAELLGAPAPAPPPRAAAAPSRRLTPKRVAIAAGAFALVLVLVAVAVWRLIPQGPAQPPGQNGRVDVMAFEPQGADAGVRKVADETQATLVRILAGAGVQVAAVPQGPPSAADDAELHMLGTVTREADNYVTSAQVVDRKSGVTLWNDRIVRTITEQEAAPDDVAQSIAAVVHCALEDRKPSKTPVSTEAFGLYLNACASVFVGGGHERMLVVTRRLVKLAPQFAGGHAMHSIAAAAIATQIENSPTQAAALHAEAKAAAELALKIDPRTAKAYSGLALNEGVLGGQVQNWFLEEQYLKKALALDPDLPPARNEYTGLLRSTGRTNDAIAFMKESEAASDPRSGAGDPRLPMMQASRGDLAGAAATLQNTETVTRSSQDPIRWTIAFWWEDPKAALAKIRTLDPGRAKGGLQCYETYLAELPARQAARTRGLPDSCDTVDPGWRIRMLAREGDVEGAFAAIKLSLDAIPILFYYPETKPLRRDPRFWPLVSRMGLADYWLKSNNWPDFCSEPDLPYDCRKIARTR